MIQHLQNTAITLVAFFLLLFAYTKLAGPIPFSVNSVSTTKSDTFQVQGEGRATIQPDIALVNVGVTGSGATVKAAQDQMNININKVTESIKAQGVGAQDIQTQNYSVNPNYDFNSGIQRINGYQASTNISIKIRDLNKANLVIDIATQNGANQVGGISFTSSDNSKAENEAREKAVADAKSKAESASKIAGFSLGRIINYSESFNGVTPPMPYRAEVALGSADNKATQVEPGTNEVVVNVILSYEVR